MIGFLIEKEASVIIRGIIVLFLVFAGTSTAAQERPEGVIRSVNGNSVEVQFDDGVIAGVGDEIEFVRSEEIVDPVSGNVRGRRTRTIGKGVVQEIGLGGVRINVTEFTGGSGSIMTSDRAILTGTAKSISRPQAPRYGEIQEIANDRITTTLGIGDNISEGDIFLIQRTVVSDADTDQPATANEVNIGRMSVESVQEGRSEGRIIEMKEQPLMSDRVVRESDYLAWQGAPLEPVYAPADTTGLQTQINDMRKEISMLRARIDSIGAEQNRQRGDFNTLKLDIEQVVDRFMAGDFPETVIRLKNDEPALVSPGNDLLYRYEQALDACLGRRFDAAIDGFNGIMRDYPDSRLTENCMYWIAQSLYSLRRYNDAAAGFQAVLDDRRFTHKDDDASIMLAVTFYQMGDTERAIGQFQRFLDSYPDSEFTGKVGYWVELLAKK